MDARPRSVSLAADSTDLTEAVVRFCRMLRVWGVHMSASASQTAVVAMREIEITQRNDFRSALRIAILQRPEDAALFTYLFNAFWRSDGRGNAGPANESLPNRPVDSQRLGRDLEDEDGGQQGAKFQRLGSSLGLSPVSDSDNSKQASRAAQQGLSGRFGLAQGSEERRAELDRLAGALSAQLATRPSRRCVPSARGNRPDLRALLRQSLRSGGVPVEMRWRERRFERTRLVVFCDVSRSMDEFTTLFLEFTAAVLHRAWNVDLFLFASDLTRVTDLWMNKSWDELRELVPDCGGGTQLGASLQRFLDDYGRSLGGRSIIMILSDGLDAGDPALVSSSMERLHRRSRGVIWLNPLLALPGYEPRAQGMAAALAHIDVFEPVHDVESLWRVVSSLRKLSSRSCRQGVAWTESHQRTGTLPWLSRSTSAPVH